MQCPRCQNENPTYPAYASGFYPGYLLPEACSSARQRTYLWRGRRTDPNSEEAMSCRRTSL
jgi:hypothetical protein